MALLRGADGGDPVGVGAGRQPVEQLGADRPAPLAASVVAVEAMVVARPVLARDQQDVSAAFGGGVPQEERFRIGEWREGPDGVPELVGAQANLACVIDAMLAYGTHSIVIARVLRATVSDAVTPLIYQDGAYL